MSSTTAHWKLFFLFRPNDRRGCSKNMYQMKIRPGLGWIIFWQSVSNLREKERFFFLLFFGGKFHLFTQNIKQEQNYHFQNYWMLPSSPKRKIFLHFFSSLCYFSCCDLTLELDLLVFVDDFFLWPHVTH